MDTFNNNKPEVKKIVIVSRYMLKKWGEDEAIRRTIKGWKCIYDLKDINAGAGLLHRPVR